MTLPEIYANAAVLVIAGSETTATALSGTIYYLLQNHLALQKLTAEVRSTFRSETEINFGSVNRLEPARVHRRGTSNVPSCARLDS